MRYGVRLVVFLCIYNISVSCLCRSFLIHLSPSLLPSLSSSLIIAHHLIPLSRSCYLSIYIVLSSFEAPLSFLLRSCCVSQPFLRRDALALLCGSMLFTLGLLQQGIWESLAAGLANAVVRISCVHAAPPKCKRSSQIARTLCIC